MNPIDDTLSVESIKRIMGIFGGKSFFHHQNTPRRSETL